MRHITEITKAFYRQLNSVEKNVFPIVATEGTRAPFIVFERTGVAPVYNKDGYCQSDVFFSVKIVTVDYYSGLELVEQVTAAVPLIASENVDYSVELTAASEEYAEDAFVQTLNYTITTQYYN